MYTSTQTSTLRKRSSWRWLKPSDYAQKIICEWFLVTGLFIFLLRCWEVTGCFDRKITSITVWMSNLVDLKSARLQSIYLPLMAMQWIYESECSGRAGGRAAFHYIWRLCPKFFWLNRKSKKMRELPVYSMESTGQLMKSRLASAQLFIACVLRMQLYFRLSEGIFVFVTEK